MTKNTKPIRAKSEDAALLNQWSKSLRTTNSQLLNKIIHSKEINLSKRIEEEKKKIDKLFSGRTFL